MVRAGIAADARYSPEPAVAGDAEQLDWRPSSERWSIGMGLAHLAGVEIKGFRSRLGGSLQGSSLGWVECALACRREARAMTIRIGTYWTDMWLRGSSGRAWGPVESWTPVREADRTFIWLDPRFPTTVTGV